MAGSIWDTLQNGVMFISRLPLERWLFHRKPEDSLERLKMELQASGPIDKSTTLPVVTRHQHIAPVTVPQIETPTTEETVAELNRRLGKELYRMELDLAGGARIAGKPCDCLASKHHFGIEATAEELIPYENRPIYSEIISWLRQHEHTFPIQEVAKTPPEFYKSLAPDMKRFRKTVLGTESLSALITTSQATVASENPITTLAEAKEEVARLAAEEVEKKWQSKEKT